MLGLEHPRGHPRWGQGQHQENSDRVLRQILGRGAFSVPTDDREPRAPGSREEAQENQALEEHAPEQRRRWQAATSTEELQDGVGADEEVDQQ